MIQNLEEQFLYRRLPEALVSLDERGIISAIVGGIQDRLDDLRSYSRKLQYFFDPNALPDGENNVVLVDLLTDKGVAFTRSLDFQEDTPADGTSSLTQWAAAQLGLEVSAVANVRYGRDLLRLVDANTVAYLAETIGAVVYNTNITTAADAKRIVSSYFPRLRIKGTARSFEVTSRLLGFDDAVFVPLWGRVSPRMPSDPGSSANDPDFAPLPDYWPQQTLGPFYDPHVMRDGAFYAWAGTVNNGTASTAFYSQIVNGFNPYVEVVIMGSLNGTNLPPITNGTITHPADGNYVLAGGAPHAQAYADPDGASVRFRALAEGDTWNGLVINICTVGTTGTERAVTLDDRLSTIKYRTSYFDMAIVADIDAAGTVFGERSAQPNKDLEPNPSPIVTFDGVAVGPYRPWIEGSISTGLSVSDWLTITGTNAPLAVVVRHQASGTNRELNFDSIAAAGIQASQAMEDVRPATRFPRQTTMGLLINEPVHYACYLSDGTLFTTDGITLSYTGSHPRTLLPNYVATVTVYQPVGTAVPASQETGPLGPNVGYYHAASQATGLEVTGTYHYNTGTYQFAVAPGTPAGVRVVAHWIATNTEVIRDEATYADKLAGTIACQDRPEDSETDGVEDNVDDYPWLRAVTGGGDRVEADTYIPENNSVALDAVEASTAVTDQSGVANNVYVVVSGTGPYRTVYEARPTDTTYSPGQISIGYRGTFRDLSAYTGTQHDVINAETDFETMFLPGFEIFHIGLVNGVLVADPTKFYGEHHRANLVGWFPVNEHIDDDLTVVDHSVTADNLERTGISYLQRAWDSTLGWYLSMTAGALLTSTKDRSLEDNVTVSFWIKPSVTVGTGTTLIYAQGPISFSLNNATGVVTGSVNDTTGTPVTIGSGAASGWTLFYIRKTATAAYFGYGTAAAVAVEALVSNNYQTGTSADTLAIGCGSRSFGLHDVRVWNTTKTQAQMELVRNYAPTPTIVNYRLSWIYSVNRQDHYGMRVLANGLVVPDALPPSLRTQAQALVRRYISTGSYIGLPAFKEVGLGGGVLTPDAFGLTVYPLGYVFPYHEANGTVVVAGTNGLLPGQNQMWLTENAYPNYVQLSGVVGVDGTQPVYVAGATATVWPDYQVLTNPNRDALWVAGDNSLVYELRLFGGSVSTSLTAELTGRTRTDLDITANPIYRALLSDGTYWSYPISGTLPLSGTTPTGPATITSGIVTTTIYIGSLSLAEQITGAEVRLTAGGQGLRVAATGSEVGVPYVGAVAGTETSPPLWLYLYERTLEDVSDAWMRWVGGGIGFDDALFGNTQSPFAAALDADGILEFQNSSQLVAGRYRLFIESANIGKTDVDFDGFAVEVSLNNTVVATRLLRGQNGYNIQGTDVLDFDLPVATNGDWLLAITWTNAFADPSKGVARQLKISSYRLVSITHEQWRVSLSGASLVYDNTTPAPGNYSAGTGGGWLRGVDSLGQTTSQSHEILVYPFNENGTSLLPLSDLLTGSTNNRREDIIIRTVAGTVIPPGATPLVLPSFGPVVVT